MSAFAALGETMHLQFTFYQLFFPRFVQVSPKSGNPSFTHSSILIILCLSTEYEVPAYYSRYTVPQAASLECYKRTSGGQL